MSAVPAAFLFPGQGSQRKGMGGTLFDTVPEYQEYEYKVDEVLGYSLRQLCLSDSEPRLHQTRYTQPAMYVVNALHFNKASSDGAGPAAVAGHSLGEYNALLAAGVFDFFTGLRLVKKRGELMAEATNGSMSAVKGLDAAKILPALRAKGLDGIDLANLNAPTQSVISGPVEDLKRATAVLQMAGAQACIPLPVSAAFHSRYMTAAAQAFGEFLNEAAVDFREPQIPVISNVTARPYPTGNPNASVRSLLTKQILRPVQWVQSMRYLRNAGINEFREIGNGDVLTRLASMNP